MELLNSISVPDECDKHASAQACSAQWHTVDLTVYPADLVGFFTLGISNKVLKRE